MCGRTVVVEELGDEVDVGQQHSPAAVALQAKLVKSLARVNAVVLHQVEVLVPLVADNLK